MYAEQAKNISHGCLRNLHGDAIGDAVIHIDVRALLNDKMLINLVHLVSGRSLQHILIVKQLELGNEPKADHITKVNLEEIIEQCEKIEVCSHFSLLCHSFDLYRLLGRHNLRI